MKIHPIGFGFLQPYCEPYAEFSADPEGCDFVLSMNNAGHEGLQVVAQARQIADAHGIPLCWWTIEDPNAYAGFINQARIADHVFTSDKACIPFYQRDLGHDRAHWLPLACCEKYHRPLPVREDATDCVFSGNWYDSQWEARRWGVETVILPLAEAGYSITCFSLDRPPYPVLLEEPNRWIGPSDPRSPGYFSAVAEQYTWGKIVLGVNNQRSGMDGREKTYMTSMRTFEALACGKPFLAAHSDAYEALGLDKARHMAWSDRVMDTLGWAKYLTADPPLMLTETFRAEGRAYVLANHTYGHRMEAIMEAIG